jgi:hypothetical protein
MGVGLIAGIRADKEWRIEMHLAETGVEEQM